MLIQELVNYNNVPFEKNTLYYGDNLDILKNYIPNDFVDLIYLDPPFNSKADYNVLFREKTGEKSTAQVQVFSDFWHWNQEAISTYNNLIDPNNNLSNLIEAMHDFVGENDMLSYLVNIAIRLLELYRVLKPTGSIFLHCDTTASHYLKLLMDSVFEIKNFRNEIIWKRTYAHSGARRFGPVHDTILFYSKSDEYKWNPQQTPYSEEYKEKFFKPSDNGEYTSAPLTAPGVRYGYSGKPWRGIDPTKSGRHWAIPGYIRPLLGGSPIPDTQAALDKLDSIGRILWPEKADGMPRFKQYLDDISGVNLQDVWTDIPPISSHSKERLGFQTQKPVALLERIINSGSNEGDLILDPFCGCGTSVVAAERLRRHWIGIDVTWLAIDLVKTRLFTDSNYSVEGEPRDLGGALDLLRTKGPYEFQWWAISLIKAVPVGSTPSKPREGKKGADKGIDGWIRFHSGENAHPGKIVVQVKSGHVEAKDIREFRDVISRNADMGIFITLKEPTREMVEEVNKTEPYISPIRNQYTRIQIITIKQLLDGKKPEMPPTLPISQEAQIATRPIDHRAGTLF